MSIYVEEDLFIPVLFLLSVFCWLLFFLFCCVQLSVNISLEYSPSPPQRVENMVQYTVNIGGWVHSRFQWIMIWGIQKMFLLHISFIHKVSMISNIPFNWQLQQVCPTYFIKAAMFGEIVVTQLTVEILTVLHYQQWSVWR